MLRVTVEFLPDGNETKKRVVAKATIGNTSMAAASDYKAVFLEQNDVMNETVSLEGYPRWAASVWDLVARLGAKALNGGKEELPPRPALASEAGVVATVGEKEGAHAASHR